MWGTIRSVDAGDDLVGVEGGKGGCGGGGSKEEGFGVGKSMGRLLVVGMRLKVLEAHKFGPCC